MTDDINAAPPMPEFAKIQGITFGTCGYTEDGNVFLQQTVTIEDVQTPVVLTLDPDYTIAFAERLQLAGKEAKARKR